MKKNISIIGASGYSGAELLSYLVHHQGVSVNTVFANSSAGKKVSDLYPRFRSTVVGSLVYQEYTIERVTDADLIFIALPSGEAMHYVPALMDAGKKIIDLGGDFRLKNTSLYRQYYHREHIAEAYLPKAIYGLPEWNSALIPSAQLIANPGCYVTSALLPLLPLIKENLIEARSITINALSGVSGAGRSASVDHSFTEINESVKAYKVGIHQHTPEIESVCRDFGGKETVITFIPHLIPVTRGIYSTITVIPSAGTTDALLEEQYRTYYSRAPFVRLLGNTVPELKSVQHSNYIDIGWKLYERNNQLIIHSAIDNLVKGASGQAIQNMNLLFGFDETEGLR